MAFDYDRLAEIGWVAATATVVYANPAATTSYVRNIILHNTDTVNQTVTLYNVPDSAGSMGTPAAANQFLVQTLTPNTTLFIPIEIPGLILTDQNDLIAADDGGTGSKVTIQIMGGVET